jgi:hypothetical protein
MVTPSHRLVGLGGPRVLVGQIRPNGLSPFGPKEQSPEVVWIARRAPEKSAGFPWSFLGCTTCTWRRRCTASGDDDGYGACASGR